MARIDKTAIRLLILTAILLPLWGCMSAMDAAPAAQDKAPANPSSEFLLPALSDPDQQAYLGIDGTQTFALEEIHAPIVLIEVFSMYCPHCQREAPNVNRLYRHIDEDPLLASRVKLIGIGVGNTTYEVDLFRKAFDIPFPLFPDRSRRLAFGLEVRETPTFVGFARKIDGGLQRILFNPGPIGDMAAFLDRLLESADRVSSPDV